MPRLTDEEKVGTSVAGRWKLIAILARGGSGVVYEAFDARTKQSVAVKLLRARSEDDPTAIRRFEKEARSQARIAHPSIVKVLASGVDHGSPYLVLERLYGRTLAAVLAEDSPLEVGQVVSLLEPLTAALAAAHRGGLVHRDLKPSNVFLARHADGSIVPKILDFGLVKTVASEETETESGVIVGTPRYMSPEQAAGDQPVGPPTDVWSLGIIAYECLEGHPPYAQASPTAVLMSILRSEPPPPTRADCPEPLRAWLEEALERDLERRPADGEVLAARFQEARHGIGGASLQELVPAAPHEPLTRPLRTRNRIAPWLVGTAALAALGYFFGVQQRAEPRSEASELAPLEEEPEPRTNPVPASSERDPDQGEPERSGATEPSPTPESAGRSDDTVQENREVRRTTERPRRTGPRDTEVATSVTSAESLATPAVASSSAPRTNEEAVPTDIADPADSPPEAPEPDNSEHAQPPASLRGLDLLRNRW
ncbi:MAG: serine/threonine-protein kinase [Myxococcota bacterium]